MSEGSESIFDEMKRYVRFGNADEAKLSRFWTLAAPEFQRIAAEFYDRIREHEGAHAVFTGEEQIARLQRSLVRWMDRVFSRHHDAAYYEESAQIGRVHVRIGLPQRYMFTAMALLRVAFVRIAEARMGAEARATIEAIHRALDLELAIMLETYREDSIARIQNVANLEKQEASLTLRRVEHRYQNAVEHARVLIIGLDRTGVIRLWNREAERVTGFARDEVLGKPLSEALFDQSSTGEHPPEFEHAARGEHPGNVTIDGVLRTRVGNLREVRFQFSYAADGEALDDVVLFILARDVTEEKALSARVHQTERLASVGTLAAGLAHEIRNPLNGAQLHLTFLRRELSRGGDGNAEALDAVRTISEQIKRLSELVTEFLDFARPRPLKLEHVRLSVLLDRVLDIVSPGALAEAVSLTCERPPSEVMLEIDLPKMEQVLLNVLLNAVEAVPHGGGGAVMLRARKKPRKVVLEIEDNGHGLPSPDAPIFDPFFSTKPTGTGLGLAIAHRIVTDHDGAIDVESKPGQTVFYISIPLRAQLAEVAPKSD
jgi:PAS domain S-box-containing protein